MALAEKLFWIRPLAAAVMVIALLGTAAPALAHHKDGHDNGKPSGSETNESNDGDPRDATDPNEDEGDNAHPSGKDRSREAGGSGNQGKSESDPDDDGRGPDRSNGGPDKPGGSGGVDKDDQDSNNGCGNDDDFEDDNEGLCRGKKKDHQAAVHGKAGAKRDKAKAEKVDDAVLADEISKLGEAAPVSPVIGGPTRPAAAVLGARPAAEVLGVRMQRGNRVAPATVRRPGVRGRVLPFTGNDPMSFVLIALGLMTSGYLLLRRVRA
jgi:hypothetical protein